MVWKNTEKRKGVGLFRIMGLLGAAAVLGLCLAAAASAAEKMSPLRPPSVPLVACDPYFSVWSASDTLYGEHTRHWTGKPYPLTSLIRIDGKTYRLMGGQPADLPVLTQTGLRVFPTRTLYTFESPQVRVEMCFLQAALPEDIDLLSRPVVYVVWTCTATDNQPHQVSVYLDAGMELVVDEPAQEVVWSVPSVQGLKVLKAGSKEQNVLGRKGDDVRIDWGYLYIAASDQPSVHSVIASAEDCRGTFAARGVLPTAMDEQMPRAVRDGAPVMAMQIDLGSVRSQNPQSGRLMLAYDDIVSILYFGRKLPAYWKRNGKTIEQLLTESQEQYDQIARRCEQFDAALIEDLYQAGGADYAAIASLAYRQAFGANKITADSKGMPLMFSKECFSNGCMATVDISYPFAPQVLLLNPTLAKASFVPILEYGRSERWKFPFAPHDIGTYPHASGQAYGGGERSEENQMPVEECGNMILLSAAVTEAEGDIDFVRQYWDILSRWAEYLKAKGLDPENQLCTDDFAGHLAHNVNLSAKAVTSLGAYAKLADQMGRKDTAALYRQTAEEYVRQWMQMADDGDHYRLAFDKPGTWSQKYNLIWDRVLKLNLFPSSVVEKEMAFYHRVQNTYGLPLDSRSQYTKLDWITWTACLTGRQDDFEALVAPIVRFLNETPDRVPMSDWYWTHNARQRGFQARPVVGGVFIRLMTQPQVWTKWVSRAPAVRGTWAPLPKPPIIKEIVPTSLDTPQLWYYTFEKPSADWMQVRFDAAGAGWKRGAGGFGMPQTPGARIGTRWNTADIWMRRTFQLEQIPADELHLLIHHDEDAEVYINGVLAARLRGYTASYEPVPLSEEARRALRKGPNSLAVHCHQTTGGQYIDVGLATVKEQN